MSDLCVDAGERADECAVLAGRHRGNATYPTKCRGSYRQARARRLRVTRQGIGGIRIEPIGYAIQQLNQPALHCVIDMEVCGNERRLPRMQHDAPAHDIGTRGDRFAMRSIQSGATTASASSSKERHMAAPTVLRVPSPAGAPALR